MKTVSVFFILTLATPAFADGQITPQEKRLMELVDQGRAKAEKLVASSEVRPSAGSRKIASDPPAPLLPGDDDVVARLSRQLQSLKEKDALLRSQAASTQKPSSVKRVGVRTVFNYKVGAVYEIHAGVDRITDIELQSGERLTSAPVSGDTVRWTISAVTSGKGPGATTHLILKPLEADIETNLMLTTDRYTYHLRLLSSDWYMPSVAWNYPQEKSPEFQELARKEREEETIVVQPDKLSFDYGIDGSSYKWKPLRVFDDGTKTYLQMPSDMRVSEAPVLFVIDEEEKEPILVNYRVKGNYYIVDRLFEKGELRVGKSKSVEIEKGDQRSFFDRWF